jgi:hypothetical protein
MFNTLLDVEDATYENQLIIGKVIANDDSGETVGPKLERVRAFVPGLYEGDTVTDYPWIFPKQPSLFGNGTGFGRFGVPDIGAYILIELQNGDPHFPYYVGGVLIDGLQISEAGTNYPNRYGFKDSVGNIFFVDKTSGEVKFQHKSGTVIDILNDGTTTVHAIKDLFLQSDVGIRLVGPTLTAAGITGDVDFSGIGGNFKTP